MFGALLVVMAGVAPAARAADDATGTWKWTVPAQGNRPERTMTLTLKQDGEKLTGTLSGGGQNAQAAEIADGKVKDGEVSFKVTRKRQDTEITSNYTAKVSGDTLKGKSETTVNGNARTSEIDAKRVKE
jgi:hypothetical protein